jgi:uncharacterized protein YyaL (SSP411 family)
MVVETLRAMAKGGMNDQLGGGFHRYSVDANWFVPHFEKMLYDQAQLAISYLEAFQITGERGLADTARQIFDYVLRDMLDAEGGFYSAEDADSVVDAAQPHEKGEGAFYIWTQREIENILGRPAAEYFCYMFGVEPDGNVREDPQQEFIGKNILFEAHSVEDTADHFGQLGAEVEASIAESKRKLLVERSKRIRPHLDDKVLTAWNGLMISAFAKGGAILAEPRYTNAARRAADFLLARLYDADTGTLLRRYRQQDAAIPGFLDDYAFFAQGLLDLYEADFRLPYLETAIRLTEKMLELFEDKTGGAFFTTAIGDPSLVMRIKDDYDGAEPSGNSIAALNLLRLGQMTSRADFREAAQRLLQVFAPRAGVLASAIPQLLAAYEFSLATPKQIVVVGGENMPALLGELHSRFLPNKIVLGVNDGESRRALTRYFPALETMAAKDGAATAYVCENSTCQLPTAGPEVFAKLLQAP